MAGILTCAASVLIFSMLGIKAAKYIPGSVKEYMTLLLSVLCFLVAITSIQKAADLMPVALALCVGGILGSWLQLTKKISTAAWAAAQKIDRLPFGRKKCTDPEIFQRNFVSVMTVICLSGAGIMGIRVDVQIYLVLCQGEWTCLTEGHLGLDQPDLPFR